MAKNNRLRDILSTGEISAFCTQIAMIMRSGISVGEGIGIMTDDMKNTQGKAILQFLRERVDSGSRLHIALEESGKFPKYVVDMTEIGEVTGRLEEVMENLSNYYEREESIAKSIRNAVTYPIIMIVMMVAVVGVLIVQVLPVFSRVFQQLGSEMTGMSLAIMNFGQTVSQYAIVILGVIAVILLFFLILKSTGGGRRTLDKWKAGFFVTRRLNAKIASGRFASAMSLMLASGLDTDQSIDMVYKLVDNDYLKLKIATCKSFIAQGANFSDALVRSNIFIGIYAQMIHVGFRTGSVDIIMRKLADRYEEEIDTDIGNIISVLEPTLVAILSIIVGLVLLSVMLPLMSIMTTIG